MFRAVLRHRELLGALMLEVVALLIALGSLGVKSLSSHCDLLGALVLRCVYVIVSSWEPWCEELVTSL